MENDFMPSVRLFEAEYGTLMIYTLDCMNNIIPSETASVSETSRQSPMVVSPLYEVLISV